MRKNTAIVTLLLIVFSYGLFLNRYSLTITEDKLVSDHPSGFYDYRGVINVHSDRSTGSGAVNDIISAAKEGGLDFLIFTELNQFESTPQKPNYSGRLLVSYDKEYSYRKSRILNILGSEERTFTNTAEAQLVLSDLVNKSEHANDEGLFIIAHPLRPKYVWEGNVPSGIQGLEIINLKAIWQNAWLNRRVSFFWTLFTYLFNERLALMRLVEEPEDVIQYWDSQNNQRPTLAFAGADAESKLKVSRNFFFQFPSYETLLTLASNHILLRSELTGDATDDHKKIAEALRTGSFYLSIDTLADPKGFNVTIEEPDGSVHAMGSSLTLKKDMELVIQIPQKPKVPFDVLIYRNGKRVFTSNSLETRWVIHEAGVYRVKVRVIPTFPLPDGKKWIPWIYSNSFYVNPKS